MSTQTRVDQLIAAERRERRLASGLPSGSARDRHSMLAERYADAAWSLAEGDDGLSHVPSSLWAAI